MRAETKAGLQALSFVTVMAASAGLWFSLSAGVASWTLVLMILIALAMAIGAWAS